MKKYLYFLFIMIFLAGCSVPPKPSEIKDSGIYFGDFAVTKLKYAEEQNIHDKRNIRIGRQYYDRKYSLGQKIQQVFGSGYRVADWNDLKLFIKQGGNISEVFYKLGIITAYDESTPSYIKERVDSDEGVFLTKDKKSTTYRVFKGGGGHDTVNSRGYTVGSDGNRSLGTTRTTGGFNIENSPFNYTAYYLTKGQLNVYAEASTHFNRPYEQFDDEIDNEQIFLFRAKSINKNKILAVKKGRFP